MYFSCHGINKSAPIFVPFRVEQMEHTDSSIHDGTNSIILLVP